MTTTTGDPSTLKTPASLSSGDLVSRLLAATPPYLYNVPLTPHSFFFSEMLRSFVQAKTEASAAGSGNGSGGASSAPRRRKRSWRDARDRPLELTMKERPHHHQHHHHHHHHQHPDKYYHSAAQQQQQSLPQVAVETRLENDGKRADGYHPDAESKAGTYEQKPDFGGDILKPVDENKMEFPRQHGKSFFDERPRHFEQAQPPENGVVFPGVVAGDAPRKIKPEDSQQPQDRGRSCNFDGGRAGYVERAKGEIVAAGQEAPPPTTLQLAEKKLDFARGPYLPGLPGRGCEVLQGVKGFTLPGGVSNPAEFLPSPLWYPPYPMPQSYPGIDPLHFFIDLRVSGHIWDRKHANERQLPFKSKHCSAFSVPQSKEYSNRPLNLTRDEATTSKDAENTRGTNYILKHLTKTYQDIQQTARTDSSSAENEENSKEHQAGEDTAKVEDAGSTVMNPEDERKDLRALIGLELVVDYVKEPKGDPPAERASPVTE
ncbi:hypothetical protein DMN91_010601 [Ooceraea biroi]|uniref:Uncharacterized protein n=1 Tax=Ooceraea biroi TaxID=2015173 RepID=A0A026WWV1_OOCBI|nr:uncharacterized protein LOC105274463 [Ooceraea biroi]EZA60313.1 hypothetical protein X777_13402 [Ooceraea biroi]RLU16533.1 hypothetical protein DMN91_010601 [Ooceraea biroi]